MRRQIIGHSNAKAVADHPLVSLCFECPTYKIICVFECPTYKIICSLAYFFLSEYHMDELTKVQNANKGQH